MCLRTRLTVLAVAGPVERVVRPHPGGAIAGRVPSEVEVLSLARVSLIRAHSTTESGFTSDIRHNRRSLDGSSAPHCQDCLYSVSNFKLVQDAH